MSKLKEKYLARFDELINEGKKIKETRKTVQGKVYKNQLTLRPIANKDKEVVDNDKYYPWKVNVVSLLQNIIPKENLHYKSIGIIRQRSNKFTDFRGTLLFLISIHDDYEKGFLDDFISQIEAEISCDYMEQAETLLAGDDTDNSYIPAAVLSGAVLENNLRSMCERQELPIKTKKQNGDNKTLTPLIDELKKAKVYNELKAKQLRGWTAIRNAAAHGEFDQFTHKDVKDMISGINNFLADYME